MLDVARLKQTLPSHLRSAGTQALVDKINGANGDPEIAQEIRENFVSYSNVLESGRFKIEDYLSAVTYVSFKMMNYSNQEAWLRTFPQRHLKLTSQGKSAKEISSHVANYNKNKLVNLIMEQTIIPSWVLNQDVYQEAINTQLDLMRNANSEKVRAEAANSILTHLKKPETKKVEIDLGIGAGRNSALEDLKGAMAELAEEQLKLINSGMSTRDIAHQSIVSREPDEFAEDAEIIEDSETEAEDEDAIEDATEK